jgi:chitin synthase
MIKGGKKLLNPLVAAQNFEYKMSNILGTILLYLS